MPARKRSRRRKSRRKSHRRMRKRKSKRGYRKGNCRSYSMNKKKCLQDSCRYINGVGCREFTQVQRARRALRNYNYKRALVSALANPALMNYLTNEGLGAFETSIGIPRGRGLYGHGSSYVNDFLENPEFYGGLKLNQSRRKKNRNR